MEFCIITPDRNDRPLLTKHMFFQMERQTVKPQKHYHVNGDPTGPGFDLVTRVIKGIEQARADGFEYCYIIENDDYYPDNYFEHMAFEGADFVGIPKTIYYNIMTGDIHPMQHAKNSSLFCTGFKISALKEFKFPPDYLISLDLDIWQYVHRYGHKYRYVDFDHPFLPIGIKHGLGMPGGTGHTDGDMIFSDKDDNNRGWLKARIRPESFEFYKSLSVLYKTQLANKLATKLLKK